MVDALFAERVVDLAEARDLPCNTGVALSRASQSALGRVHADKRIHLVRGDRALFDVRGRSAEQRIALDLLADPDVGIVSLGGPAGTGKSVLALAAGLEAVLEQRTQKRVVVFRPIFAVGGQDLGYLPGSETEKMAPWGAAVTDALEAIAGPEVIDEVLGRGLLEVLPLTHIRGRNLTDTFVIIDEAQNLERPVLLTALSRLGQGSRVVLTHDVAQRDNLRVGRHDGVVSVIAALAGHPLFGHVTLTRSERSPIAALVTAVLDRLTSVPDRLLPEVTSHSEATGGWGRETDGVRPRHRDGHDRERPRSGWLRSSPSPCRPRRRRGVLRARDRPSSSTSTSGCGAAERRARHLERCGVRPPVPRRPSGVPRPGLGLRLQFDPTSPCAAPRCRATGAPTARWYDHGHIDAYRLYRGDVGPSLRVSCSLKSIARLVGLSPVEVDRGRIHDLSNEALHAYVSSDARLARVLTERRAL